MNTQLNIKGKSFKAQSGIEDYKFRKTAFGGNGFLQAGEVVRVINVIGGNLAETDILLHKTTTECLLNTDYFVQVD